jgi:hypothetical protein
MPRREQYGRTFGFMTQAARRMSLSVEDTTFHELRD